MRNAWPQEVREEAVRRYLAGESASALARELGPSRQAILRWVREAHPGASRPVPESLRRNRQAEPVGAAEDFWASWEDRQRELAQAGAEPVPEPDSAPEPAPEGEAGESGLSPEGEFRFAILPYLLLGIGGGAIARAVREAIRGRAG